MEGTELSKSAPLPGWALLPTAAILAVAIFYVLLRTRTWAEQYLIFACWFRYMVAAFHEYTFKEVGGGLSIIALSSIAIVALGFLTLDKRRLFIWAFFPVAIICVLMLVSGFTNQNPKGAIEPIVRNAFFVVVAVAFWQAIDTGGPRAITRLLWVFATPITFQVLSIVLHVTKAGESDGSVSYIGGYNHEQPFSLILATCFVVACFATRINRWLKFGLSVLTLVGIALANYRTTILGMAPLAAVQLFTGIPAAVMPKQRSFVRTSMIICGLGGLLVIGTLQSDRFADVGTVLVHGPELMKPPEAFTGDERRILSGRVYLWSNYIDAYENGTTVQKIIGRGPDSWSSNFAIYAHNTLVSYLYEMGIIGVAAILLLWATIASVAMRAQRGQRATILGAHASFFLLNMATMPHWQIEGNILYGLICGYTLASARAARLVTTSQRRRSAAKYFTPEPETLPVPAR
jgi:hypothetical protein